LRPIVTIQPPVGSALVVVSADAIFACLCFVGVWQTVGAPSSAAVPSLHRNAVRAGEGSSSGKYAASKFRGQHGARRTEAVRRR
jgi:hypothetical protein